MPEASNTREWAKRPEGGPDEQKREIANIVPAGSMPTREYAVRSEGGPDELARGGQVATAEPPVAAKTAKKAVKVEDPLESAAASRE